MNDYVKKGQGLVALGECERQTIQGGCYDPNIERELLRFWGGDALPKPLLEIVGGVLKPIIALNNY